MTTILMTSKTQENGRIYFEMTSGKKDAAISYNFELGMISVLCKNASHKAWKGFGKTFWSFSDARDAYKSSDMKAMIELVEGEVAAAVGSASH